MDDRGIFDENAGVRGPLEGLRALDVGTMIAGPLVGTLLGDYGADVIKIEKPKVGDPVRSLAPFKDGKSLWWKVNARNKRLVTLDLAHERGRELFLRLVEETDIIIENFRPGTFARWGYAYETLSGVNPGVILLHTSGYGQTGPYAPRPGYGTVAEALSGVVYFTGFPDKPPTLSAFALVDTVTALFGLAGVLAALHERARDDQRRGQEIDIALYESLFRLAETQVIGYDQLGIVKERRGNKIDEGAPRNIFLTRDHRYVAVIASSDRTFVRLMSAIGAPELAYDPRFRDNASRIRNEAALDEKIGAWVTGHTLEDALEIFKQFEVTAGPVYSILDIFRDPHFAARANIVSVEDEDFGVVRMQGVVPRFSASATTVHSSGGSLGRDNLTVFGELGLDEIALADLDAAGVI